MARTSTRSRTVKSSAAGAPQTGRPGEVRLPAAVAVAVAIALYATLPGTLLSTPRVLVPAVELALLAPLVAANPYRMTRQNRRLRALSLVLCVVLLLANGYAFVLLLHVLVDANDKQGGKLLVGALQVWVSNLIAFALTYWELDRGGPVARHRSKRAEIQAADFRFTQDEDADTVQEVASRSAEVSDWRPRFVDYLYLSTTNSTAFSPTDTMPLSPRAKLLMGLESVQALLISILVIARGVSLLH
jgi:hypothetical protein